MQLAKPAALALLSLERQKFTAPLVPLMCTVLLRNNLRMRILMQVLWLLMVLALLLSRPRMLHALAGNRLSRPRRRRLHLHQSALRRQGVWLKLICLLNGSAVGSPERFLLTAIRHAVGVARKQKRLLLPLLLEILLIHRLLLH